MCRDEFEQAKKGDMIKVVVGGTHFKSKVMLVGSDTNENKTISFDIPQTQPRLVIKYDSVYLETRPLGYTRELEDYTKVKYLGDKPRGFAV